MKPRIHLSVVALILSAGLAHADIVQYGVIVNTSSLAGRTDGYIEFQFNQAPLGTPGAGTAQISDFVSFGFDLAGELPPIGNVSGSLATPPIVMHNDPGANVYDEKVNTWGQRFQFNLKVDNAASDSSFLVFLLDSSFAPLTPTLPDGDVGNLFINPGGGITVHDSPYVTFVPEPGTWILLATTVLLMASLRRRRTAFGRKANSGASQSFC